MEEVWSFDYRTKGWTYSEFDTWMIASPLLSTQTTWADLAEYSDWESLGIPYTEWDDFEAEPATRGYYMEHSSALYKCDETVSTDAWDSTAPPVELETGDYDFGAPNTMKIFTRLSVRVTKEDEFEENLTYTVYGSTDKGQNWKTLGTMTFYTDRREAYLNFRMKGSLVRFKFISTSAVSWYGVDELDIRVTGAGTEYSLSTQDAAS